MVVVALKGAVESDVCYARVLPELEFLPPTRLVTGTGGDPNLDAETGGVAAILLRIGAQLCELRFCGAVGGIGQHHPSVAPFCDTPKRQIMMSSEPNRHAAAYWQRIDARIVDLMPAPAEIHMRFGPQSLHELHLFLRTQPPIAEILVEPYELNLVPADPDPQPEPAAAQHVKAGGLLGDQHGLPLGQNEHLRREANPRRTTAEKAKQNKGVVE